MEPGERTETRGGSWERKGVARKKDRRSETQSLQRRKPIARTKETPTTKTGRRRKTRKERENKNKDETDKRDEKKNHTEAIK